MSDIFNCDGGSCFWALLGLMALAAILGGIIGWILRGNQSSTQTIVDSSSADAKLSAELNALKGKYASLEKEHSTLNTQFVSLKGSGSSADTKLSAELNALKGKYANLEKEHASLNTQYITLQGSGSSSSGDETLTLRIKELEAELKAAKNRPASASSNSAAERKAKQAAMFAALAARKGEIDLGRIGSGSLEDKDNLKRLSGLGSLQEKKLNALGIYKFTQMANLTSEDETKLNELLNLPKDKFKKSGWVLESKRWAGLITEDELILTRVKGRKSWLNYDRIGLASVVDKDDLQKINGIGPFIEDKLNALEIYTFAQMSKLTNRDVSLVNDAIELNEGHIDRDNWVGQAKSFLKKK